MKDINVVVAGAAGEGIQTVGDLLSDLAAAHGYAVFGWKEYESRIRGGTNRYAVRIGEGAVNAPLTRADVLLAFNESAARKYREILHPEGLIIAPSEADEQTLHMDFHGLAKEKAGKKIYANTVAVGALVAALGMDSGLTKELLGKAFSKKSDDVVEANIQALEVGMESAGRECRERCRWKLPRLDNNYYVITGNEAIPLAAVRAGCRFIAAYPMTPSTGIITFLAQERGLGVFAEQAEDEIAAVNMAIGASYAGARAMTATSGGGFALMNEGISLAGMTETPLVIVCAQRPGPATGLPTRTAQGDLLFSVHSGHGEFPKAVLAPSDPKDAFYKIVKAFDLADRFQTPVIVLTDQFLADAHFSYEDFDIKDIGPETALADPAAIKDYKRYRFTEDGISPRLYPGQSHHLVAVDSDEHDEAGHITEDLKETAPGMVRKRLSKARGLQGEMGPPEELSLEDAEAVFISWGSTRGAMVEALDLLGRDGVRAGLIHFTELWPLPRYAFPKGKTLHVVETNATGQFERLLRSEFGASFDGSIRRYDGLPLTGSYVRRHYHEHNG